MIHSSVFIHELAYADEGCDIGEQTKVWHFSHIMPGACLGKRCTVGQNVFIAKNVVIGDGAKVQNNVSIYEGVICEDDVFLGPSMVFTNVINPRSAVERKDEYKKTLVKKGASIGANATIICGSVIGRYAFVGAGAVVTRDVPDFALVLGNPARKAGWVSRNGQRLPEPDENGIMICPATGEEYKLSDGKVELV